MVKDKTPKVFICHADKDEERFVREFAKKLRENDVDVWYDENEISLGDDSISKINNGLENRDCAIIIFSNNIINAKGAQMEISSLIHDLMYENKKIIPVIIDYDAKRPPLLKPLKYIKINDLSNYDAELSSIIKVISNQESISQSLNFNFAKESVICKIFEILVDFSLKEDFGLEISATEIFMLCREYSEETIYDALYFLESKELLKNEKSQEGLKWTAKSVTGKGVCTYFYRFIDNPFRKYGKMISLIYEDKENKFDKISEISNINLNIIKGIINLWHEKKYVNYDYEGITEIYPTGKYYFENILKYYK